MNKVISLFGWYGLIAIVLAYTLVSLSILEATDLTYQILNGTGAIGIVLQTYTKRDYQPMILNIIWTIIALVSILKILYN